MDSALRNRLVIIGKLALVFFFVYVFLISIGLMGAAFKGFGKGFAEALLQTTTNPFVGLFIGLIATSLIQSSSTTTSIVVGMVAGGAMTITNAIPLVMGANIGTTVTNIIVSLGHITRREEFKRAIAGATVHDFFNLICVLILFPIEMTTHFLEKSATVLASLFVNVGGIKFVSPLKLITQPVVHLLKELMITTSGLSHRIGYILLLVLSAVLLFISLYYIVRLMRSLVIERTEIMMNKVIERAGILGILAGMVFTAIVQSSSITTSLLIPLIGAGILTVEMAFPITIGANIGTTATAILASFSTGNPAAITIAFVHFLFNAFGTVIIYPIKFIRRLPIAMAKKLGEVAYHKRHYAIMYLLLAFFVLPISLILISNALK